MYVHDVYHIVLCSNIDLCRGLEQFMKKFPRQVNYCKEDDGHTALHIAAANNHLDIVCLLAAMVCRPGLQTSCLISM